MLELNKAKENVQYKVKEICGDDRFISRITSIGITIGNTINIIKNKSRYPVLIYSRDTVIAIGRNECDKIAERLKCDKHMVMAMMEYLVKQDIIKKEIFGSTKCNGGCSKCSKCSNENNIENNIYLYLIKE